ncbi:MAG: hypothetical protein U0903_19370 [Planctomycetales bacterium]
MPEITPETTPVSPALPPRKNSLRKWIWGGLATLLLVGVAVLSVLLFRPEPKMTDDVFLFNWQAMVDEETAAKLVRNFTLVEMIDTLPDGVEPTDSLRRWRMQRDRLKATSDPITDTACYRGSSELLRQFVSMATKNHGTCTSRELHWKQVAGQSGLLNGRKPQFKDRLSSLFEWNTGPRDQGILVSGCIDNDGNPDLPPGVNLTASGMYALSPDPSANRIRMHLYGGQVRFNGQGLSHADDPSRGQFISVPFGWDEWLKPGDVVFMINRFPEVKKTPVLITVCERYDLPTAESLDLIGVKLNTPRHWIDGGPAFVTKTIQKINDFSSKAPLRPNPLPQPWTQALPDGTQVTLLALAQPDKFPRTFWTPVGTPVNLAREIRDHLITTFRYRGTLIGLVYVSYPGRKSNHLSPIDFSEIIPDYSTRTVNNVGLLWNQAWKEGNFSDSGVEVQFGALPVRADPEGKGQGLELALGYGDWKVLGNARASERVLLSEREIRIGQSVPQFSNRNIIDVAANWRLQTNEESSLVLITKAGKRVQHCYPPPIHLPAMDGVLRHRRHHEAFYDVKPGEVDHFEVRVRPTRTIRFTGFVSEPDSLKTSL